MKNYIIRNKQYKIIVENIQQAEKHYFSKGIISPEEKQIILNITNNDNYTYYIASAYLTFNDFDQTKIFYKLLKEYNNKIFPIKDFNELLKNLNNKSNVYELLRSLEYRSNAIRDFNSLPNILKRNIKEKNIPRNLKEMDLLATNINYMKSLIAQLSNRPEHIKNAILKKAFSSKFNTIDDIINFFNEKENLIGGKKITKKEIKNIINSSYNLEADIIYEKNNLMVIEIWSPQAMQLLGCNSLWCFTYKSNDYFDDYYTFNEYSTNGIVYMIIDFNKNQDDKDFMHVLIKPLSEYDDFYENSELNHILFDLTNEGIYEPINYLQDLFKMNYNELNKLFNFDIE